jgi:hypothetical protein
MIIKKKPSPDRMSFWEWVKLAAYVSWLALISNRGK